MFGEYLSVNAVTNDAVDPISFQPEFKACAVSLTRVAATPQKPGDESAHVTTPVTRSEAEAAGRARAAAVPAPAGAVAVLADLFGIADLAPPVLAERERRYLSGFLTGLDLGTPGTPVLPAHAPLGPERALWVNGVLAGMFSRIPAAGGDLQAPGGPGGRLAAASAGRAVLVLWASQTGNAEEVAVTAAKRLANTGRGAALLSMDGVAPDAIAPDSDLLIVTSTFGDGEAPDNGPDSGQPSARPTSHACTASGTPSWLSATPPTTTSVATAAVSTGDSRSWVAPASSRGPTANRTTNSAPGSGWTRCSPP